MKKEERRLPNVTVKEEKTSIFIVEPFQSSTCVSPIAMVTSVKTLDAITKMVGPVKKGDTMAVHAAYLETIVKLCQLDEGDLVRILQLTAGRAL